MSSNWKLIGRNSGNMSHHRNVASNKLNYETGKWDSIYDVSGKDVKGYTFDICGQNIVLGVGTNKPFSRLSLGNNSDSGKFNANKMGQLAAIALDEKANGQAFTGILLNSDLISTETLAGATVKTTSGIQIMSSIKDFSLNDISNGQIYLTNNNVTTIGGEPRVGNEKDIASTGTKCPGTYGNRKIVLDVRGSVRTDGYINFYNQTGAGTFSPTGTSYNNTSDIPKGSLFLTNGGGSKTGAEGLYFKNTQDQITLVAGTGSGGSTTDISAAFDVSLNGTNDYQYIVNKAKDTQSDSNSGGVPVTFSGKIWPKSTYNTEVPSGFNNAVTIRDGNLAVITPSGDDLQLINAPSSSLMTDELDASGGIILAQRQLLIGSIKNDTTAAPHKRYGYGRIDIQGISNIPSLQCYNYTDPGAGDVAFKPEKATNAIILITKNATDDGSNVGPTNDCSNTIIIGGRFETIDTPNSIISNIENINSSTTAVTDISGSNIVFGYQNKLTNSCYTLIMGAENTVDNTTGATTTDAVIGRNQNNILGSSNLLFNSENSFVQGHSNKVFGNQNIVFGNTNILGNDGGDNNTYKYFTQKSFIQGNSNQITSTYEQPVQNVFIAGKNNKLDMSYNSFTTNTNSSYTLLGTYAGISGEVGDTSNVRFAFGTYEKWQHRGGDNNLYGNVLTIDGDGHTRIYGSLTVDGSFVKLDVIHKDVSDNNITLGSNGYPANGGGITILDNDPVGNHGLTWQSLPDIGSTNYWHTEGADLSTNNLFVNNIISQDISANDASFNDISAVNFYGNISTTTGHSQFNDISGHDASFVDISAVNYFSVGSSFFGDIHAKGHSSFNDLSGNDASFNDVSTNSVTIIGTRIFVDGKSFTFPSSSGTLTTTSGGGGVDIATNIAGGAAGDIPYQTGDGQTSFILTSGGTTGEFLKWNSGGAAPSWETPSYYSDSDLPTAGTGTKGCITTNYTTSHPNYKVQMSGTDAYVSVPHTDTNTTYAAGSGIEFSTDTSPVISTTSAPKIIIAAATANTTVIEDTTGTAQPILKATAVASGSHYITIENGGTSPYIKSTSGLFIETTDGGDIALGNNANALKLTMPDNGSGAGETFTIEGQEAGGTSHDKGGNVKIIGGTGADTNGGGGDVEIVGGAKRAGGNGDVGNILLQGGYSSTGVTINPAGNISTKGTLTVDSTSTLTGNATFGGDIVADANEAKNIFAAVTSNNITIGGTGSTTVVDGLSVTQASTLTGHATFGGDIVADANEAKNIFAAVTSNNITIGGTGSTTVVDGLTVNGDISANDISANDISCVDISAVNFFSVGSSFFGDVHATGSSSFNDLSGNDASFNDISANSIFSLSDAYFGGDIVADGDEAKNIFAAVTSKNITIGGSGSTTVVDGLTVNDNVGIGTSSPIHPLQIGDNNVNMSVQAASGMVINGTINNSFESDYPERDVANDGNAPILIVAAGTNTSNNLSFGIGGSNYNYNTWIQGYYDNGSSGNGTKDILLQPDGGNVGISETSPDSNVKLHIKSAHNDGCRLKIESSGTSGWKAPVIDLVPAGGSNNLILANGPDGGITMRATDGKNVILNDKNSAGTAFTTGGCVGIGTDDPEYPLEVATSVEKPATTNMSYLASGPSISTTNWTSGNAARDVSIKTSNDIWMGTAGSALLCSSDERIKENITEVPDNLALQMLRDIDCNYYEYKDKIGAGIENTIGFIAQQVKEHLPMAVSLQKSIIPNEMRVLEATWDGLNMSSNLTDVSGVKYRFYVSNDPSGNDEVKKEIVGNEDNTFTFDKHYNNVFCYGKEVDDFHTVDKQKLFTVNFSATQEIDKIQQEEKTKLAAAEAKIATLEARLSALENQ